MKQIIQSKVFQHLFFVLILGTILFSTTSLHAQIVGDTSVCAGDTATYYAPFYSGSFYLWSVSGGTMVPSGNSCKITWSNSSPGTISVLISGYGLLQLNVTVHPIPVVSITRTAGMSICSGFTIGSAPDANRCDFISCENSIETFTANVGPGYSYFWQVNGGTITSGQFTNQVTVLWASPASGYISCTITSAFGCVKSLQKCVKIISRPMAAFSANGSSDGDTLVICKGTSVAFFDSSANETAWNWFFGDGAQAFTTNTTHVYNTSGFFTATLVAENACKCSDTARIYIKVDTTDAPELSCVSQVCFDDNSTYCVDINCPTYIWNVSGGVISSGGGVNDSCIGITWGPGPYGTISLAIPSCPGSCPLTTTFTVPIIGPNGPISGDTSVCSGETVLYSIPEYCGSVINWNVVNAIGVTFSLSPGNAIYEQNITWYGSGTADIVVDYYNYLLDCGGKDTLHIRVKDNFSIFGPPQICLYQIGTYFASGPAVWIVNGGTITAGQFTPSCSINWNTTSGNMVIKAVPLNPNLYCNDTAFKTINVLYAPDPADSITGPDRICPNTAYNYIAHFSPISGIINWTVQNGVYSITGNNSINVLWGPSGPYSITVTQTDAGTNCASLPLVKNISLAGIDSFIGSNTACSNTYSTFTVFGSSQVQWSLSPASIGSIISGQGTNSIQILWNNAQGAATLTYTVCGVSYTHLINVIAKPPFALNAVGTLCPLTPYTLSVTPPFASYNWNSGASLAPTFTITNTQNVNVQLVAANGCIIDTTFYVQYKPAPVASISTASQTSYCLPATPNAMLYALNGPGYTFQWQLNSVNIPFATSINYLATAPGSYTVVVTDSNGCTKSSNGILIVVDTCLGIPFCSPSPPGNVLASASNYSPDCDSILFMNLSDPWITNFTWNFGDSSAPVYTLGLSNVSHRYLSAGFYLVTLFGNLRCPTDTNINIILFDTLVVEVPIVARIDTLIQCRTVTFTDISNTTFNDSIIGWKWEFGNGDTSLLQNPVYTYPTSGLYPVTLTVYGASGCRAKRTILLVIDPSPVASYTHPASACVNTPVNFNNTSTGNGLQYLWDFGDSTSSTVQNTAHTYNPAGIYFINLYVNDINGCKDTANSSITIWPNTINASILATDTSFCMGDSAILTALPSGLSYLWSNTSTSQSITAFFGGNYTVTVSDTFGCSDDTNVFIKVNSFPPSLITISPSPPYCSGSPVVLNACIGNSYLYTWHDSSTFCNLILYTDDTATVYITDTSSGCSSSQTVIINFNPSPPPPIITANQTNFCLGDSAMLIASYTGGTLLWSNGSTSDTIIVKQAGTYSCTVTDSIGCSASASIPITVNPLPDLCSCISGCYEICEGDTICVQGNYAAYQWMRNDTILPTDTNQCIIITLPGTYRVILTTLFGCIDTSNHIDLTLYDCSDTCYTTAMFTKTTNADTVFLTNTSSGNGSLSYVWDFGDGDSSFLINPYHVYAANGTYTICLYVTNTTPTGFVCKDTLCDTVTINDTSYCEEFILGMSAAISCDTTNKPIIIFSIPAALPGDMIQWDFLCNTSIDTTVFGNTPVFFNNGYSGPYTVCATVTRIIGGDTCKAYPSKNVIYYKDTLNGGGDSCVCDTTFEDDVFAGYTITISGNTVTVYPNQLTACDSVFWSWSDASPNDSVNGIDTVTHTYAAPGTYYICMFVIRDNDLSCQLESCKEIIISSIYDPDFSSKLRVYPNPTNNWVFIDYIMQDESIVFDWQLRDQTDRIVKQETSKQGLHNAVVDMQSLSAGIYYLHVISKYNQSHAVFKIMKY